MGSGSGNGRGMGSGYKVKESVPSSKIGSSKKRGSPLDTLSSDMKILNWLQILVNRKKFIKSLLLIDEIIKY